MEQIRSRAGCPGFAFAMLLSFAAAASGCASATSGPAVSDGSTDRGAPSDTPAPDATPDASDVTAPPDTATQTPGADAAATPDASDVTAPPDAPVDVPREASSPVADASDATPSLDAPPDDAAVREDASDAAAVLDAPDEDAALNDDAGDASAVLDAPPEAAAAVTYVAHIQPIVRTACSGCHETTGIAAPFVDSYAVTQQPSMAAGSYGCPGMLIGECMNQAAQAQELEGSYCRTYVQPFHRDGFQRCLTDDERALFMAWVVGGMLER